MSRRPDWYAEGLVLFMFILALVALTHCASCAPSPDDVNAWTSMLREAGMIVVALVGLSLHRNRTRRKAIAKAVLPCPEPPEMKEPPCSPSS